MLMQSNMISDEILLASFINLGTGQLAQVLWRQEYLKCLLVRHARLSFSREANDSAAVVDTVIRDAGFEIVKRGDARQGRGPHSHPKGVVAVQNDRSEAAARSRSARHGPAWDTTVMPLAGSAVWRREHGYTRTGQVGAAVAARRSTACKNGGANRR